MNIPWSINQLIVDNNLCSVIVVCCVQVYLVVSSGASGNQDI